MLCIYPTGPSRDEPPPYPEGLAEKKRLPWCKLYLSKKEFDPAPDAPRPYRWVRWNGKYYVGPRDYRVDGWRFHKGLDDGAQDWVYVPGYPYSIHNPRFESVSPEPKSKRCSRLKSVDPEPKKKR